MIKDSYKTLIKDSYKTLREKEKNWLSQREGKEEDEGGQGKVERKVVAIASSLE